MGKYYFGEAVIPEWAEQDAVILAWPNDRMDWADHLEMVHACYLEIISASLEHTHVVLLVDREDDLPVGFMHRWTEKPHSVILINDFLLNDTWMRDVMPLFGMLEESKVARDFGFNGWGLKFPANHDNTAVRRLFKECTLFHTGEQDNDSVVLLPKQDYILEGGAIESDGRGTLMTTDSVICEANRNVLSENRNYQIERLKEAFAIHNIYSLGVQAMRGDDTDGHIDTLARFIDEHTIVYNYTEDKDDVHYDLMQALQKEVQAMLDIDSKPYKCVPLPIPSPIFDEDGMQLPATYANFLITNGAILVPIYQDPMDQVALKVIQDLKPEYKVVGIDCRALILQHGSLHCITMQVPKGFLNPKYL